MLATSYDANELRKRGWKARWMTWRALSVRRYLAELVDPVEGGLVDPVFQGLTLVHFSAQLERFSWDRGCA